MTDSEREEFVYDLANHDVTITTKARLVDMVIDRMSDILLTKSDEELEAMAPPELLVVTKKTKAKRNKAKPFGFH